LSAVLELAVGILLATGAVYFVLRPVLRPEREGDRWGEAGGADEGEDPEDDLSPRAVALRALKEIEFDRATGKLSDADYEALEREYTAAAVAALRGDPDGAPSATGAAAAAPRPVAPLPRPASPICPTHGLRPESDAQFCSECGRRLASAPGYCARCGTVLEREAQYCHACGARVAA
jgi:hypothetical protein